MLNLKGREQRCKSETGSFWQIFYRRKIVLARLEGIQKALSEGGNLFLNKLKKVLTREYNQILAHVDVFWYQKSRCQWKAKQFVDSLQV